MSVENGLSQVADAAIAAQERVAHPAALAAGRADLEAAFASALQVFRGTEPYKQWSNVKSQLAASAEALAAAESKASELEDKIEQHLVAGESPEKDESAWLAARGRVDMLGSRIERLKELEAAARVGIKSAWEDAMTQLAAQTGQAARDQIEKLAPDYLAAITKLTGPITRQVVAFFHGRAFASRALPRE